MMELKVMQCMEGSVEGSKNCGTLISLYQGLILPKPGTSSSTELSFEWPHNKVKKNQTDIILTMSIDQNGIKTPLLSVFAFVKLLYVVQL